MEIVKKLNSKLRGSVLALTTLILVAITTLISMIFLQAGMVTYYQSMLIKTSETYEDIHIGINYLLYDLNSTPENNPGLIQMLNDPENPVVVLHARWGFFEVVGAQKTGEKETHIKMGFVGYLVPETPHYSLYLLDEGTPLTLCGKTHISGDVYLPPQGVKRGYAGGLQYEGEQLIYGNTFKSESSMPKIFHDTRDIIHDFVSNTLMDEPHQFVTLDDLTEDHFNPFTNPTKIVYDESPIFLSNIDCRGKYFIESEVAVIVDKTAYLEHVIIKAPYIEIDEGFKGSVQCIASDSVFIDEHCHLQYPSVVSLIVEQEKPGFKSVMISDSSSIEGLVFVSATGQEKKSTLLTMQEGASVLGQVYCNGIMNAKGKITGMLVCRRTILFTPSSIHENYLLNTSILTNDNKRFQNILPGVGGKGQKDILKWI